MQMIKRYVDVFVPVEACSLRCHYCYITTHRKFATALPTFKYSPQHVREALSTERMGGCVFFSFCGGGETLLPPEMPSYFMELLSEGHYVGVVTNGTVSRAYDEILKFPKEYLQRMFFKFSFHYLELKKRNLIDRFFSNVRRIRASGAAITVEVTPNDELIPYIDEVKSICLKEVGAWPHVSVARDENDMSRLHILTKLSREEYERTWSVFDSELFRFKMSVFEKKQPYFCHAGDWTFFLNLGTGVMRQCYCSCYNQNIFEDVTRPISFKAIGHNCMFPHCYNAHVFLGFGDMLEVNTTRYGLERNRICDDGTEWLNETFKKIMMQRLEETNPKYSNYKKLVIDIQMNLLKLGNGLKNGTRDWFRKIKHVVAG